MSSELNRIPKYEQIAQAIAAWITERQLGPGDRLPTVAQLSEQYDTNHNTITAAIKSLALAGLVESRKRAGILVCDRSKKSPGGVIALLLGSFEGPVSTEIISHVERQCQIYGYRSILMSSNGNARRESELLADLPGRADGVIVIPVEHGTNVEGFRSLISARTALVFFDQFVHDVKAPIVSTDHAAGAYFATKHLIECGCTDFRMLVGGAGTSREDRVTGFKRALLSHGILDPSDKLLRSTDFSPYNGYRLAADFLAGGPIQMPMGFFVTNDYMAQGVYAAVKEAGYTIGREIRIVGFDDLNGIFMDPPLSTVRQDFAGLSRQAVATVVGMIETKRSGESVLLIPELVVRSSCRPESAQPVHQFMRLESPSPVTMPDHAVEVV